MNLQTKISIFSLNIAYYSALVLIGRLVLCAITLDIKNMSNFYFDSIPLICGLLLKHKNIVQLIPYSSPTQSQ